MLLLAILLACSFLSTFVSALPTPSWADLHQLAEHTETIGGTSFVQPPLEDRVMSPSLVDVTAGVADEQYGTE